MSSIDGATQNVIAAQQAQLFSQVGVAVQSKVLDAAKQQGQAFVQLIDQAAQIGKSVETGRRFDATG